MCIAFIVLYMFKLVLVLVRQLMQFRQISCSSMKIFDTPSLVLVSCLWTWGISSNVVVLKSYNMSADVCNFRQVGSWPIDHSKPGKVNATANVRPMTMIGFPCLWPHAVFCMYTRAARWSLSYCSAARWSRAYSACHSTPSPAALRPCASLRAPSASSSGGCRSYICEPTANLAC